MYTLSNDRLTVNIAEPNRECMTSRFDRAGFVTGVRLDGQYDFLGQEDMLDGSPSSGGMGFCSEIQCDPMSAAAAVGEKFPKFGVGLLTQKKAAQYNFMDSYETEDFDITVEEREQQLVFTTHAKEIGGYAVSQIKTVSIRDNTLTIAYSMKNEGTKTITFDEYCHNFMTLNHKKVCRDYYLTIPCLTLPEGEIKTLDVATTLLSDGVGLTKSEESMVFSLYAFSKEQMRPVETYGWKLVDRSCGLCVEETDDFTVDKVTVWSVGDVISPEMFFTATLAPGEETSWSRTYRFSALKA